MSAARRPRATLARALDAFAAGLDHASWFAAVGEPLTPSESADAAGYLAGLGLAGARVAEVADWGAAGAAVRDSAWDRRWWDAVERERKLLLHAARKKHGGDPVMAALSKATQAASDLVAGRAAEAAAARGVADPGLVKAAAGAGIESAYQAALALAAGAPADHPFRLRFSLFEAGHWPLALIAGRFDVF